jgi:hypothetical protein
MLSERLKTQGAPRWQARLQGMNQLGGALKARATILKLMD